MLFQNAQSVRVLFYLQDRFNPGAVKANFKAANATE
jgi:hypothetical protein